ncbi:MAG: Alanine--tRNA ligase [candidate division TA06 bacterium 32_111]|uniref:Alanine--tRNA ligase n=3 Tax=Bacteria candidate phyla TaxID=1783234 RepID=A0A101HZF4_UNCT6|nr:MAG: Alanine--tRNA ligase [candidate division TA06 bacterium 32_111]KUK86211.1 MAG: Alanine--tRNA ligase [candidate division TA06 bacterium 34_109]HCP16802.1 alanine--tRNA ligase [candidate division WOR-3 bacterium]
MKSQILREKFIKFFKDREHRVFESSSLIPENDPTLLFTVAGMVQFKPMFAGLVDFDFKRATSIQKCLRVVDLEEVGTSPFHDTFFEMLGNFSFNDYFQHEAIKWGWEFLTEELNIEKDKLYVTVHRDDSEAYRIWKDVVKIPSQRIIKMDDRTNFWGPAGGTGACGPSTEIFYDFGRELENKSPCSIENDCKRFVEIWNIVFPQFNQDSSGNRTLLKNKGVDTGMGLERLAALMQNKKSIFETDLFMPIIEKLEEKYDLDYEKYKKEINSIADHIRALTFSISDGVIPENEGRGYVIRRVLRRGVRFGFKMGIEKPFLYDLVSEVVRIMKVQYPYLIDSADKVKNIIKSEEERFLKTIGQGIQLYTEYKKRMKGNVVDGKTLFLLYDTFGFPLDLIKQMAYEDNLEIDEKGFEYLLDEARKRSRKDKVFAGSNKKDFVIFYDEVSKFVGYEKLENESYILRYRELEDSFYEILMKETPFYAESGGQVGDTGLIFSENLEFEVYNSYRSPVGNMLVGKKIYGEFEKGKIYKQKVDLKRRYLIQRNHTATHILHSVLRKVVGEHVRQEGSFVSFDRFRFDFLHFKPLTDREKELIESSVNEIITQNLSVDKKVVPYEDALKEGALAFFNEKYGKKVRVVTIKNVSKELCGGTHVEKTGEIGLFRILKEESVATGIRRIEAVTSLYALKSYKELAERIDNLLLKHKMKDIEEFEKRFDKILEENTLLRRENEKYFSYEMNEITNRLIKESKIYKDGRFVFGFFEGYTIDILKKIMDNIKSKEEKVFGVLFSKYSEKVNYIVFSSNMDVDAKNMIAKINKILKGKGGGKKELASGSASLKDFDKKLIESIREKILE